MNEASAVAVALLGGVRGGLHPNPLAGIVTSGIAAALLGGKKRNRRLEPYGWCVLVAGWLVGDGLWVLARARDVYDGLTRLLEESQPLWADWTTLAVWALVSFLAGYLAPVLLGKTVGRRVTHGTGWLAAGATAVTASFAFSRLLALVP